MKQRQSADSLLSPPVPQANWPEAPLVCWQALTVDGLMRLAVALLEIGSALEGAEAESKQGLHRPTTAGVHVPKQFPMWAWKVSGRKAALLGAALQPVGKASDGHYQQRKEQ